MKVFSKSSKLTFQWDLVKHVSSFFLPPTINCFDTMVFKVLWMRLEESSAIRNGRPTSLKYSKTSTLQYFFYISMSWKGLPWLFRAMSWARRSNLFHHEWGSRKAFPRKEWNNGESWKQCIKIEKKATENCQQSSQLTLQLPLPPVGLKSVP